MDESAESPAAGTPAVGVSGGGQSIVVNLTIDGGLLANAAASSAAVPYPWRIGPTAPLPVLPAVVPAPHYRSDVVSGGGVSGGVPARSGLADAVPPVFPVFTERNSAASRFDARQLVEQPAAEPPSLQSFVESGPVTAPSAQPPASSLPVEPAGAEGADFFDARHSMVEGLLEADREHTRRINRLRTSLIVVAAILALLLCAIALMGLAIDRGLLELPSQAPAAEQQSGGSGGSGDSGNSGVQSGATTPQADAAQNDEAEGEGQSAAASSGTPQSQDLSGTVRYSYTTTASEGGKAQVTETVAYDKEGYAETSSMSLSFADEAAAKAFMERVELGYGTTYLGGTRTGSNAEVRIDVSESRLNRAAYKQALEGTVQGLSVSEGSSAAENSQESPAQGSSGARSSQSSSKQSQPASSASQDA